MSFDAQLCWQLSISESLKCKEGKKAWKDTTLLAPLKNLFFNIQNMLISSFICRKNNSHYTHTNQLQEV